MRICDICRGPDSKEWKIAVVRISIERLNDTVTPLKSYESWDACEACVPVPIWEKIKREVEKKD